MENNEVSTIFIKLREIRNSKNISAKDMAELLNLETEAAYYKKESGMRKFSLDEAKKIADKIGLSIEDIFFNSKLSN